MGTVKNPSPDMMNMSPDTMMELGLSFASGREGQTDLVRAHTLLNLAAFKGIQAAIALREEIATDMTREEIVRALREARQFMTLH